MAKITLEEWARYRDMLAQINQKAADEFRDYFFKGSTAKGLFDVTRDETVNLAYGLITKYGEASSALACQFYDEIAELEGIILPTAEPADVVSIGYVNNAVNNTIEKFGDDVEKVSNLVNQLTKKAGQDTMMKNAVRDKAEFAWVPAGVTCAFCLTLASNGWQTAKATSHAEHIHSNCDCAYAIRHTKSTTFESYKPEEYFKLYDDADGNSPKAKINSMRREQYQENKEEINRQKREAYAKRIDEGN